MMTPERRRNLIKCGDGKFAPPSLICVHLMNGQSDQWVELPLTPDAGEVHDYLCFDCANKGARGLSVRDLCACCFHCVQKMIQERDVQPVDLGPAFYESREFIMRASGSG